MMSITVNAKDFIGILDLIENNKRNHVLIKLGSCCMCGERSENAVIEYWLDGAFRFQHSTLFFCDGCMKEVRDHVKL